MIRYQENGFIDTMCFMEWADQAFFVEIEKRLSKHVEADPSFDKSDVLIMDGLKQHFSDWFEDEMAYTRNVNISELPLTVVIKHKPLIY